MSVGTMGLSLLVLTCDYAGIASLAVYLSGHWLKMSRIDTALIPAQMVTVEPFGYGAD